MFTNEEDGRMTFIKRYDHVAVAVRSAREAIPFFRDVLGGRYLMGRDEPAQGYRWIQFLYPGGGKVELLEPLGEDSFLHSFLDQHGEGMHHITLKVHDLRATVALLQGKGYDVVKANYDDPHWMEAFIHPRSAFGVLIQLVETPLSEEESVKACQVDIDAIVGGVA
jgi:methylmalonyl-CoA/ethylmalonyl-CoA epimerase